MQVIINAITNLTDWLETFLSPVPIAELYSAYDFTGGLLTPVFVLIGALILFKAVSLVIKAVL